MIFYYYSFISKQKHKAFSGKTLDEYLEANISDEMRETLKNIDAYRANRTPKASTMPPPWALPTVSRDTMPGKTLDEFKKVPDGLAASHAIALVIFRDSENRRGIRPGRDERPVGEVRRGA